MTDFRAEAGIYKICLKQLVVTEVRKNSKKKKKVNSHCLVYVKGAPGVRSQLKDLSMAKLEYLSSSINNAVKDFSPKYKINIHVSLPT